MGSLLLRNYTKIILCTQSLHSSHYPAIVSFKKLTGKHCPNCLYVLSLRFNGHFPGEPGIVGVYWSKGWWRWWVVTTGLLELQIVQSSSQIITISKSTSSFYRPDALPVTQPTVSKHW